MIKFKSLSQEGLIKTFDSNIYSENKKGKMYERIYVTKDSAKDADGKLVDYTIITEKKPIMRKAFKINDLLIFKDDGKFEINF